MNILSSLIILQKAIMHPIDPCYVEIEGSTFEEVSWATWAHLHYNPETKEEHRKELLDYLKNAYESSDDQIAKEKIAKISQDPNCWFYGLVDSTPQKKWSYILTDNIDLIQPIKKEGRFYNMSESEAALVDTAFWNLFTGVFGSSSSIDLSEIQKNDPPVARCQDLRLQWLGHSTTLIQIAGYNFLFDPLFSDVKLMTYIPLFSRHTPPGIPLENLPLLDGVLFSHSHQDHCDLEAMTYLKRFQPDLFVPHGMGQMFQKIGYENIHEHGWWSSSEREDLEIFCVPARHWSCRDGKNDANFSLWSGWILKTKEHTIYFAGDTAYDENLFSQIKDEFGKIDILLMPIAPEEEENVHVNLKQALLATRLLNPKTMIPIHWGSLRLGSEKIEDPMNNLKIELENDFSDLKNVVQILKIGEAMEMKAPQ